MAHVHQIVAGEGIFEFLQLLRAESRTNYEHKEIRSTMRSAGISDPDLTVHELVATNVLFDRGDSVGLSTFGLRTCLLLEALNGADINTIYDQLGKLDSSLRTYEVVREGMTRLFMRSLIDRPAFGRLYFCSPWISLDRKQTAILTHAVHRYEERHGFPPELFVITRPGSGSSTSVPNTLMPFQKLGATIFLNRKLHSKLYIREPDSSGGYLMAIVGSQNLTKSMNIELGLKITSDVPMISRLISYFFDITNDSIEVQEG